MQKEGMKKAINILTVLCTAAMAAFVIYGVKSGIFTDRAMMEELVRKGGIWAPVTFILIQMVQVVVPIIPGGITCAVGVVIFGPWYGLLYNYIGIVVGSGINFYLARRYGQCLVKFFVKEETYDKYITWLDKGKKFDKFFALAIFFPCAPDVCALHDCRIDKDVVEEIFSDHFIRKAGIYRSIQHGSDLRRRIF